MGRNSKNERFVQAGFVCLVGVLKNRFSLMNFRLIIYLSKRRLFMSISSLSWEQRWIRSSLSPGQEQEIGDETEIAKPEIFILVENSDAFVQL